VPRIGDPPGLVGEVAHPPWLEVGDNGPPPPTAVVRRPCRETGREEGRELGRGPALGEAGREFLLGGVLGSLVGVAALGG
jgi:hypothetical protein